MPCVAFFTASVGSRMPPELFCSGTSTLTKTRSPTGATCLNCAARHPRDQPGDHGAPQAGSGRKPTSVGTAVAALGPRASRLPHALQGASGASCRLPASLCSMLPGPRAASPEALHTGKARPAPALRALLWELLACRRSEALHGPRGWSTGLARRSCRQLDLQAQSSKPRAARSALSRWLRPAGSRHELRCHLSQCHAQGASGGLQLPAGRHRWVRLASRRSAGLASVLPCPQCRIKPAARTSLAGAELPAQTHSTQAWPCH